MQKTTCQKIEKVKRSKNVKESRNRVKELEEQLRDDKDDNLKNSNLCIERRKEELQYTNYEEQKEEPQYENYVEDEDLEFEDEDFEEDFGAVYNSFAWVYDTFMDNIPYDDWVSYLTGLLKEYGVSDGLLLDMGCGTGNVTERLAACGYDMIGIDNSEEMLMEARNKLLDSGADILYLLQDMRSFELYGTVAAAVSICDSMNYILEKSDLEEVFRLVNNYLDPGGIFIFDFNTSYKYQYLMGDQVIAENREDCSFIWENAFDEEARVNIYDLTLFIQEDHALFRRYQETHYQKAWEIADFVQAAEAAGMKVLNVYDAFTKDLPRADSERLYMIVQEQGKTKSY